MNWNISEPISFSLNPEHIQTFIIHKSKVGKSPSGSLQSTQEGFEPK